MRLLHAVAFPLDWRAGSVANASAHLEGPELVLTCHILQGKPGNRKKAREKSPQQRSCSLWKQGCFMLVISIVWVQSDVGEHKWALWFCVGFFSHHISHILWSSWTLSHEPSYSLSLPPFWTLHSCSTAVLTHILHLFTPSSCILPHVPS